MLRLNDMDDPLSDLAFSVHPKNIRTVTVRDFDALIPHIPAWERLVWQSPQNVWTLLPGWVDAFLRHKLTSKESWFCSFAYTGERLVGALPIIVTPHPLLGRRWPQLRPVCNDIVLASDCAVMALKSLLAEIAREVPHHLGLNLKAVRHNSPLWVALQEGASGYIVHNGPRHRYWHLDVREGFDTYWVGLRKMRQNLKRSRRRLEKRGAVSVEIRKGSSAGEDFLSEFLALEASGWKGRKGTAILNEPSQVAFYTTLVRNFAKQGQLEWHGIRVDGRLIAGQLGVRCGQALILPKYTYDEDFSECSPGHLLTEEVIRDAFARSDVAEISPMSKAHQCLLWHMEQGSYIDASLVRLGALPLLFHFPCVAAMAAYHNHVLSRIPSRVKQIYHQFKHRGYRKPPWSIFRLIE